MQYFLHHGPLYLPVLPVQKLSMLTQCVEIVEEILRASGYQYNACDKSIVCLCKHLTAIIKSGKKKIPFLLSLIQP